MKYIHQTYCRTQNSARDLKTGVYTSTERDKRIYASGPGRNSQKSAVQSFDILNWVANWFLRISVFVSSPGRNSEMSALQSIIIVTSVAGWLMRISVYASSPARNSRESACYCMHNIKQLESWLLSISCSYREESIFVAQFSCVAQVSSDKESDSFWKEPRIHPNRAPYAPQKALYTPERALYTPQSALCTHKEPYTHSKSSTPLPNSKIHTTEPYIHLKSCVIAA